MGHHHEIRAFIDLLAVLSLLNAFIFHPHREFNFNLGKIFSLDYNLLKKSFSNAFFTYVANYTINDVHLEVDRINLSEIQE